MTTLSKAIAHLDCADEAHNLFMSCCAYLQIRVALLRGEGDIDGGAQLGACPWKLGMLSATLTLWDIEWEQGTPTVLAAAKDPREKIYMDADVFHRSFGALEMLESIVAMMAGRTGADGCTSRFASMDETLHCSRARAATRAADEQAATAQAQRGEDRCFMPPAQLSGIKDTDLARRLLLRAKVFDEDSSTYQVHAKEIHKVVNRADDELAALTKPLVADFRALALHMPESLGEFVREDDVMRFSLGPKLVSVDLEAFAKINATELRGVLSRGVEAKSKRGVAGREAKAKRQKPPVGGAGDDTLPY